MDKFLNKIILGDCLEIMKGMPDNSVDSIVTDPPYGLQFMGKEWDKGVPGIEFWQEMIRVLKPGGHLLAFSGTRTYHRMASAIEDAGFEVRDMIEWVYGSGFPKSLNIAKMIDKRGGKSISWFGKWLREWREKENIPQREVSKLFPSKTGGLTGCVANWELGLNMPTNEQFNLICKTFNLPFESLEEAEREVIGKDKNWGEKGTVPVSGYGEWDITKGTSVWEGWGTALKPAHEPVCMARKPLAEKTVAENCLKYGTGGINIDESRVESPDANLDAIQKNFDAMGYHGAKETDGIPTYNPQGRFPANLIHDNSEEVRECFPNESERFFKSIIYQAKASKSERNKGCEGFDEKYTERDNGFSSKISGTKTPRANNHPTVKPIALMEYLIKMITPKGGVVLDPFAGSGSTLVAAKKNGFNYIGIEITPEYIPIIEARLFDNLV